MLRVEVKVDPAVGAASETVGAWLEESVPPLAGGAGAGSPGGAIEVQPAVAGEASTLPAASVARTFAVCWPSGRPVNALGDVHGAQAPPSSWHSKLAPPSAELK